MIVFDLKCSHGHVFEAWFGSSADYVAQAEQGLVACPLCHDPVVEKAVMAPAISAKGNQRRAAQPDDSTAKLLAMQRAYETKSRWVGSDFAAVARRQHEAGEASLVHGEASLADARALLDDGIPILPMPFTPLARSDA
jgi:hypothetical protein